MPLVGLCIGMGCRQETYNSRKSGLLCVALGTVLVCLLGMASPALASSPLKVREVFPGSAEAGANAEYVELQMTADGQNDVDGQSLRFYDSSGNETASYTVPSDPANGGSQRSVLFATAEAVLAGVPAADFVLPSANNIAPVGGAVCFTGTLPTDCVAWGTFASPGVLSNPQTKPAGSIPDGSSLTRSIAKGCATYLDPPDDSEDSNADFASTGPTPRNNSVKPTEKRCPPDTFINTAPSNPSNSASPSFDFGEVPSEPGVSFECELDGNGSFATATACDSGSIAYPGPLADGLHTFRVRAVGEGGPDPSPASHTWMIDTVSPETTIQSTPSEPSSGFSASFTYESSEPQSTFRCQLDSGPIQVCAAAGKSYFSLSNGVHAFRVWATDNAGNKDETSDEHVFTVNTVLGDLTPPDTLIATAPSNPSPSSDASFAYSSSEQGSTFQCRLDGAAFASCDPSGVAYRSLPNGAHTFEVRATDLAGNTDSVPATYSWKVDAPLPNTRITKGPPGRIQLRGGKKLRVSFRLASDRPGSTFRCRLDRAPFKPCGETKSVVAKPGRHRFEAYAIDTLGNVETTPARRIFRVVKRGGGGLF